MDEASAMQHKLNIKFSMIELILSLCVSLDTPT
jgi:hypothetical protein